MKSDIQGISTTATGQEQYEWFTSSMFDGPRVQYDYRDSDGKLFSCVARSLEDARKRRDKWLIEKFAAQYRDSEYEPLH